MVSSNESTEDLKIQDASEQSSGEHHHHHSSEGSSGEHHHHHSSEGSSSDKSKGKRKFNREGRKIKIKSLQITSTHVIFAVVIIGLALIAAAYLFITPVHNLVNNFFAKFEDSESENNGLMFYKLKTRMTVIEGKLDEYEKMISKAGDRYLSTMILVTTPSKEIVSNDGLKAQLDQYNYKATLVLPEDFFKSPKSSWVDLDSEEVYSNPNYLTVDQINALCEEGWDIAISCTANTELEVFYNYILKINLPAPVAAYYPKSNCSAVHEAKLSALGINTVIQYDSTVRTNENVSLFHVAAYNSQSNVSGECKNIFLSNLDECNSVGFLVGYENAADMYNFTNFGTMLDVFKAAEDREETTIENVTDAYRRYQKRLQAIEETRAFYEEEMQALRDEYEACREEAEAFFYIVK